MTTSFAIHKSFAASAFDANAANAFAISFYNSLIGVCGGTTIQNSEAPPGQVDKMSFGPPGMILGSKMDDTPCYLFTSYTGAIRVKAFEHNAQSGSPNYELRATTSNHTVLTPSADAMEVYAAADLTEGWWWVIQLAGAGGGNPEGTVVCFTAGVRSRRYPSDMTEENGSRFGLIYQTIYGSSLEAEYPRYITASNGTETLTGMPMQLWSPLGHPSSPINRHTGSLMAPSVAPIFLTGDSTETAILRGEVSGVLAVTSGFTLMSMAQAGYVVIGRDTQWRLAVRQPVPFQNI